MKSEDQQGEDVRPYLKFRIGTTGLAVPLPGVWMILHGESIDQINDAPDSVMGKVIFYKGAVPVLDPEKSLPVEAGKIDRDDVSLLLMAIQGYYFGLPVDTIEGIDEISSRHIKYTKTSKDQGFSDDPTGTTEINRETIHIVDPEKLLSSKDMQAFLRIHA